MRGKESPDQDGRFNRRGRERGRGKKKREPREWRREWSFAVIELGLGRDGYWKLTPAEFQELVESWELKQNAELARCGTIAAAIYNTVRDSSKRPFPFTAEDIFPSLARARQQAGQFDGGILDEDEFDAMLEQGSDAGAVDAYFSALAKQGGNAGKREG
jgi:hypothetical protein